MDSGNGGRHNHMAQGAEAISVGWVVAGVGSIQVYSNPFRERKWVAGATERCYNNKRLMVGGAV